MKPTFAKLGIAGAIGLMCVLSMSACSTRRPRPEPQPIDGPWTDYHENGQKSVEGSFANGHRDGHWKWINREGQLVEQGQYDKGRKVGEWRYWPQENYTLPASESAAYQKNDDIWGISLNANGGDTYPAAMGMSFQGDFNQKWRFFGGYGFAARNGDEYSSDSTTWTFGVKNFPFNLAKNNGVVIRSMLGLTASKLNNAAMLTLGVPEGKGRLILVDFGVEAVPPDAGLWTSHLIIGLGLTAPILPSGTGLGATVYARVTAAFW